MSSFEGAFQADWQSLLRAADSERIWGNDFDKPLADLLRAIEPTGLGRFVPFLSMPQLCLATSPNPSEEAIPALVQFFPPREPYRVRYVVISGKPNAPPGEQVEALCTNDPVAAANELVRLVLGTPD